MPLFCEGEIIVHVAITGWNELFHKLVVVFCLGWQKYGRSCVGINTSCLVYERIAKALTIESFFNATYYYKAKTGLIRNCFS